MGQFTKIPFKKLVPMENSIFLVHEFETRIEISHRTIGDSDEELHSIILNAPFS